ncbi:amidohydrolase [Labrenzia sp. OB1]|uniref:amidohydrolase n=1 Tax=Labrenzia sp. OB1 TaxID=1561204 RepID=UPI000837F289|nr:amidohydrolase [Labrenzia sp. OB1]
MFDDIGMLAREATEWRRHLHENPELQFVETDTAAYVADKLRSFGLEPETGLGGTGVVAVIEGNGLAGKSIGLRCELDALPIEEQTNVSYSSRRSGVMHACGHDGHMAMLLGAAKKLAADREFPGRIVLIFQPAEEFGGGGEKMIADGLFDRFDCDEVYGIHNMPGIESGKVAGVSGAVMAAARAWDLKIEGKGAHAGWPHTGIDSIAVAMDFVSACNAIVARETDPIAAVVISTTQIHAGNNYNVIPQSVHVGGTIRTLSDAAMADVIARMQRVARGVAITKGCEVTFDVQSGYPVTVNHGSQLAGALAAVQSAFGNEAVETECDPKMGTEDFSYMLNEKPGAYLFLGSGDVAPLHNPSYDFPDGIIERGIGVWMTVAKARTAA